MKKPREIKVTNTLTGKKEVLKPLQDGRITMYSCGPTVYNFIHIGNLRTALCSDMFFRYFKRAGYDTVFVRNYTDIDDRIIQRANDDGVAFDVITKKYIGEVERDYAVAGMIEPSHKTLATEHIPEMIEIIQGLIGRGHAYVIETGEVLYSVKSFDDYGKLSHKNIDDLISGIRVEINEKKQSPLDFTLWKPAKPGEPSWDSPWGKGRPGWHIECSAMARKWLGDSIDIHHGGVDLIFPHHENEIAQSEGCCGKEYVRYWLHSAFLTMRKEKMSKSLGNVFLAREFLTKFSGEVARYMLLSPHYRTEMDFSDDTIENALTGLHRIYEAKLKAEELSSKKTFMTDMMAENAWGEFVADCEKTRKEIDEAYANDFNTPGVFAALFSLIRDFNRTLKVSRAESSPGAAIGAGELIKILEQEIGEVLGVGRLTAKKGLEDINRIRAERGAAEGGAERPSAEEIEKLIQERLEARKAKDFARSDKIRDDLAARGVTLKDGPQGTTWEYK